METNLTPEQIERINRRIDLEGDDIISAGLLPSDWLLEDEPVRIAKKKPRQSRKQTVSVGSNMAA